MKYLMKFSIFALTIFFTFFQSCKEEEKIKKTQVFELRQLIQETTSYTSKTGVFFMFGGYYNEKNEQQTTVKVFAKVEGRFRLIEMPIKDIRIVIDNELFKPNILIEYFSISDISDEDVVNDELNHKIFIISCPEKFLPEKLLPIDLEKESVNF